MAKWEIVFVYGCDSYHKASIILLHGIFPVLDNKAVKYEVTSTMELYNLFYVRLLVGTSH